MTLLPKHRNQGCWTLIAPGLFACLVLSAEPPPGYYEFAEGRLGQDLRAALHRIIGDDHHLPHSGDVHPNTSDSLTVLDVDPTDTNNVVGVYSGYSITKTNLGSSSSAWNREHLWPQSYGTESGPARTDLHHLRPEQANVNSSRGNNYFDESDPGAAGYRTFTNTLAGLVWSRTSTTWEPPDKVKGDIARTLLYMAVRYTSEAPNEPTLILTDNTSQIVSGETKMGRYTTLLRWHFADPVSAAERQRNEGVYNYQGNRNPFVDRPEWVSAAFVPHLRITRNTDTIWLTWTNDYLPTIIVEQSLVLTGVWLPVTNAPVLTITNTWTVSIPVGQNTRFFRFRLE